MFSKTTIVKHCFKTEPGLTWPPPGRLKVEPRPNLAQRTRSTDGSCRQFTDTFLLSVKLWEYNKPTTRAAILRQFRQIFAWQLAKCKTKINLYLTVELILRIDDGQDLPIQKLWLRQRKDRYSDVRKTLFATSRPRPKDNKTG